MVDDFKPVVQLNDVNDEQNDPTTQNITCPKCGMTSYHPVDIKEGYCDQCHDWTGAKTRFDLNLAVGALQAVLHHGVDISLALTKAVVVVDDDGNPTNVIEVEFNFLPTPYLITVESI